MSDNNFKKSQLSVVVCTFNRLNLLKKCIDSLLNQSYSGKYEIIVIDNCSSDGTSEYIKSLDGKVRYIYEPIQGLSRARNRGVKESKGKYIAFIDDDAIADFYWVENIAHAFDASEIKPVVLGGRVDLYSNLSLPDWLNDTFCSSLGYVNYGSEKCFLKSEYVYGLNMAFDKHIFKKFLFCEDLGRKGTSLLSNEESHIQDQIRNCGGLIMYIPEMKVLHYVPKERLKLSWHIKRQYWQGKSNFVTNFLVTKKYTGYSYLAKELLLTTVCVFFNFLFYKNKYIKNLIYLSRTLGYFVSKIQITNSWNKSGKY